MLGLVSCEKVKDMIKFNVGVQSQNVGFNVPVIATAGERDLAAASIHLNIDSIIKAENKEVGVDNIKSAKVTEVTLEILNPDNDNNLAIVESAKVLLSSDTKTEQVVIAEMENNPDEYRTTVTIPAKDVDLAEYLRSSNYSYTLWAKTRRGTTIELRCKATIKYDLQVGM